MNSEFIWRRMFFAEFMEYMVDQTEDNNEDKNNDEVVRFLLEYYQKLQVPSEWFEEALYEMIGFLNDDIQGKISDFIIKIWGDENNHQLLGNLDENKKKYGHNCRFPSCIKYGHYREYFDDGKVGMRICSYHAGLDFSNPTKKCFIGKFIRGSVKICNENNCVKTAIFSDKRNINASWCKEHKKDGSVDARLFRCNICRKIIHYGEKICTKCKTPNQYFE